MARAGAAAAPRSAPSRGTATRAPTRRKSGPAPAPKTGGPRKPRSPAKPSTARKPAGERKASGARKPTAARKPAARTNGQRSASLGALLGGPLAMVAAAPRSALSAATSGALLDRLLRGRGWVACVGLLLAGIVFFNVSLLELNSGITRTSARSAELKRENAQLRARVAELGSSERIQRLAEARGMFLPAPGDVQYGRSDFEADGRRAARRLRESSQLAAGTTTTSPQPAAPAPVAEAPAAPAPAATPEPAPTPTAQATPAPTAPTAGTGG